MTTPGSTDGFGQDLRPTMAFISPPRCAPLNQRTDRLKTCPTDERLCRKIAHACLGLRNGRTVRVGWFCDVARQRRRAARIRRALYPLVPPTLPQVLAGVQAGSFGCRRLEWQKPT